MLTDSDRRRSYKTNGPRRRAVAAKTNRHWSDTQKIEAVQMYLLLGNLAEVGRQLQIPDITLRMWKVTQWWKDIVDSLKSQETIVFGQRLKTLIEKSLLAVDDRLANGDVIYNQKTGELIRKPVAMKDALKVATDLIDKRQKLERPEQQQVAQEGVMERLEKLAKSFEAFATKKVEVTDVIFVKEAENALPEEREEGLQEGVQEVPLEAEAGSEQSSS